MNQTRIVNNQELMSGELWRRDTGKYVYSWNEFSKRRYIYAATLEELRRKEEIVKDRLDRMNGNIDCTITLDDMYGIWRSEKSGIRENTMEGYISMYRRYVLDTELGQKMLIDLKKPFIRSYYLSLIDSKKASVNTISGIHQVLHQVLQLALDYDYIQKNPSDNLLGEILRITNFVPQRRIALSREEQDIFLQELSDQDIVWKAMFLLMITSGLRVSELVGLQWHNINFKDSTVTIDHTLCYYKHSDGKCTFEIHSPKTPAGRRVLPLMDVTKEMLLRYKHYAEHNNVKCTINVNGYNNFVFVNTYGLPHNQQTLNRFLKRVIRSYNEAEICKADEEARKPVLLPNFSCHCLRHTFATRFCEHDKNFKKLQYLMGQRDIQTTLNLYSHGSLEAVEPDIALLEEMLFKSEAPFRTSKII